MTMAVVRTLGTGTKVILCEAKARLPCRTLESYENTKPEVSAIASVVPEKRNTNGRRLLAGKLV